MKNERESLAIPQGASQISVVEGQELVGRDLVIQEEALFIVDTLGEEIMHWPEWEQAVLEQIRERGSFGPHDQVRFSRKNVRHFVTIGKFGVDDRYITWGVHVGPVDLKKEDTIRFSGPQGYFAMELFAHYIGPKATDGGTSEISYMDESIYDVVGSQNTRVYNTDEVIKAAKGKTLDTLAASTRKKVVETIPTESSTVFVSES